MVNKPAPEGQEFRLASGKQVSTIEELLDYLEDCSEEEFSIHVTEERNDFASWVRNVHGKEELADEMSKFLKRKDIISVLREAVEESYEELAEDDEEKHVEPVFEEPDEKTIEKVQEIEEEGITTAHGEFVLKEFIYGMIFGFILGMMAAGIITSVL